MEKHYDKQFKLDAVQYYHDHRDLCLQMIMKNCIVESRKTNCLWQVKMRKTSF